MHRDGTVSLHGLRLHYTEWGAASAPAVVMLHGVTGHARTWDEEARALAGRCRVVVVNEAGHTVPGDQPAVFLAALTEFLTP